MSLLRSFSRLSEKATGAVMKTFSEVEDSFNEEGPNEAGVYKSLLVDMQMNQLHVSREYQSLFKEKEEEIKRLKIKAGEPLTSLSETEEVSSPKKEREVSKPLKDLSPEDLKVVLREWERKMKNNIIQKTEAMAEAQIYRESVEILRKQNDAMKNLLQEKEKELKKQVNHDQSRAEQEAAMEKVGLEVAAISEEATQAREKLRQAELEIAALRMKAESDARTLELLSKSTTSSASSDTTQEILKLREEEFNRQLNEINQAKKLMAEELESIRLEKLNLEENYSKLKIDFEDALQMNTNNLLQAKENSDEKVQSALMERDQAIEIEQKLKAKCSELEILVKQLETEKSNILQNQAISSQKELDSALENAQNECNTIKKELNEARDVLEKRELDFNNKIKEKEMEITELLQVKENLEAEKSVIATLGAENLEKLNSKETELAASKTTLEQVEGELNKTKSENEKMILEISSLKTKQEEISNKLKLVEEQTENLSNSLKEMEKSKIKVEGELEDYKTQTKVLIEKETSKVRKECEEDQARALKEQADKLNVLVESAKKEAIEFKEMYTKETVLRRQTHDELMDLKGNIRVFARVRPILPNEAKMAGDGGSDIVTEFPPESNGKDLVVEKKSRFEFDMSFDPTSTQEQVFELVSPLIVSVMDGVNVTLFAYGQTGSGKTFTMQGTDQNPGVNTRALQRVFEISEERKQTYTYTFSVSVLEVYLETILDLLGDVEAKDSREKLDIKINPETKTNYVPGLTRKVVTNMKEVNDVLALAASNRTVGAHNMNEHSSRSHLVFTLTSVGTSLIKKEKIEGNLNLIDLAGSERVGKTEAVGERLKEAQSINKSLSALGDVISALGEKKSHIPFRNSKLTYLLQDQLSGNAKVGFFANVSPAAYNASETIYTLKFAERCR